MTIKGMLVAGQQGTEHTESLTGGARASRRQVARALKIEKIWTSMAWPVVAKLSLSAQVKELCWPLCCCSFTAIFLMYIFLSVVVFCQSVELYNCNMLLFLLQKVIR